MRSLPETKALTVSLNWQVADKIKSEKCWVVEGMKNIWSQTQ